MVFPVESEERVRRRALSISQDHLRKVLEVARKLMQLVDSFVKEDKKSARDQFSEILKMEEEANLARRMVAEELTKIGGLLTSREDFLRFTEETSAISDICKGIGFRLLEIMEREWKVSSDIKAGLVKLSGGAFDAVTKLRETAMTLNYSSSKALGKAREVQVAERVVDDLYRDLEMKVLNSKMEIPAMLLFRDITQMLEAVSDKAEDASDAASVLAFAM
jgi:predicted phosphate transport protein (TIGR00153 family)